MMSFLTGGNKPPTRNLHENIFPTLCVDWWGFGDIVSERALAYPFVFDGDTLQLFNNSRISGRNDFQ
jgi:hypothetical protein